LLFFCFPFLFFFFFGRKKAGSAFPRAFSDALSGGTWTGVVQLSNSLLSLLVTGFARSKVLLRLGSVGE
jgi:formate-dependent nitrite reductase membrane component NrfD